LLLRLSSIKAVVAIGLIAPLALVEAAVFVLVFSE